MQEIYDRWFYKAIIVLAEDELLAAHSEAKPGDWPDSDEWKDMGNTSRHACIGRALDRLGIPREDFEDWVGQTDADLDDIFGDFGEESGPIYSDHYKQLLAER